jgi:hypothetical protein
MAPEPIRLHGALVRGLEVAGALGAVHQEAGALDLLGAGRSRTMSFDICRLARDMTRHHRLQFLSSSTMRMLS